jgi:hypothetical protein
MPKRLEGQPHRRNDPAGYAKWRKEQGIVAPSQTREATRAYHANRVKTDPAYVQMKRDASRWTRRRAKYDLSREEYQALKASQDGKCVICGETPDHDLRVDHDHNTGTVRALLCTNCNSGLGMFQEAPERLRQAASYIEAHKSKRDNTLDLDARCPV